MAQHPSTAVAAPRSVILTRPADQAAVWVQTLREAGHCVHSWPLIEIRALDDTQRLQQVWRDWHRYQAVMFVSRAAVTHAMAQRPQAQAWGQTRCWATGPGTVEALRSAGVPAGLIDAPAVHAAQLDTEALWQVVHATLRADAPVLIMRGHDEGQSAPSTEGVGREWLTQQLQTQGVTVQALAVYARMRPQWSQVRLQQAQRAAGDGSVWVFSSSQALAHLAQLLPTQDWTQACALATHARIAQAAQRAGFGVVHTSRPTAGDVLRSLESFPP